MGVDVVRVIGTDNELSGGACSMLGIHGVLLVIDAAREFDTRDALLVVDVARDLDACTRGLPCSAALVAALRDLVVLLGADTPAEW